MTKASVEYEKLVAELHQALIQADGVATVTVEHDKVITGKSGATHQIDVYWEFRLGGALYKTCIECKCFNDSVKKSHVASFAAVIDDIGGATGIFATLCGFQKGAQLLAKQRNIRLVLVAPLVREIVVEGHYESSDIDIRTVELDPDYARPILAERGLAQFHFVGRFSAITPLFDAQGQQVAVLGPMLKSERKGDGDHQCEPTDLFIPTDIGYLRLAKIGYTVTTRSFTRRSSVRSNDTAKAILEDVFANTACYLHDDGRVTS